MINMSTNLTCYFGRGIFVEDEKKVKHFFNSNLNENDDLIDSYSDNSYKKDITKTESGLHLISDGMSGKYLFFGELKYKFNNGFSSILVENETFMYNKLYILSKANEFFSGILNFEEDDIYTMFLPHYH